MNGPLDKFHRELAAEIDRALITRLEVMLDRVPTNDECAKHLHKLCYQASGAWEYFWKGQLILTVLPPTAAEPCFKIIPRP